MWMVKFANVFFFALFCSKDYRRIIEEANMKKTDTRHTPSIWYGQSNQKTNDNNNNNENRVT